MNRCAVSRTTQRALSFLVATLALASPCRAGLLFDAPFVTYPVEGDASLVATADFDHDGHLDLVVASATLQGPGYLTVLLGTAGGGFTSREVQDLGATP